MYPNDENRMDENRVDENKNSNQSGESYSWGPGGQAQPQTYGYPASQSTGTNPGNSYYVQPPQPPKIKKKSKAG